MKLINKMLDNYYAEKVKQMIIRDSLSIAFIEYKFEEKEKYVILYIKKPEYKDNLYKEIYAFRKDRALQHLINGKEMSKEVREELANYLGENKCIK